MMSKHYVPSFLAASIAAKDDPCAGANNGQFFAANGIVAMPELPLCAAMRYRVRGAHSAASSTRP